MNINRKKQPGIKTIDKFEFIKANEFKLDNDIPAYIINAGSQDLVKIEMIFNAGSWFQTAPLIAKSTNMLLSEGTENYTANKIAGEIDYYGAHFEILSGKDIASVSLYTLNNYLEQTLPLLEEIIKKPVFPQDELSVYIQKRKQEFIVKNKKVKYVARKKFNELIFGSNHPYGQLIKEQDFDTITNENLIDFHKKYYSSKNCKIIIAGKIKDKTINLINNYFGKNEWNNVTIELPNNYQITTNDCQNHFIEKKNAVQSAIRIGKPLFNKNHPDFTGMQILNTVLGGYFGSRLMTNIREDKGYTYGIGSIVISMKNSGCFFITTEVDANVSKKAIHEIYREIKRLRYELIPENELNLVRNYMLGEYLRSIDGPFALSDNFIGIMEYGFDYDYYTEFLELIKNISSKELQRLANDYLDEDSMIELVVGKL